MLTKISTMVLAAAALGATAAQADTPASGMCEATSFRVYFEPGATHLNSDAEALIAIAARDVAGCADVNVQMNPSRGEGSQAAMMRSAAIAAEMRQHGLDVDVPMPHLARYGDAANAGPDYIEVRMNPDTGAAT